MDACDSQNERRSTPVPLPPAPFEPIVRRFQRLARFSVDSGARLSSANQRRQDFNSSSLDSADILTTLRTWNRSRAVALDVKYLLLQTACLITIAALRRQPLSPVRPVHRNEIDQPNHLPPVDAPFVPHNTSVHLCSFSHAPTRSHS